MLCCNKNNLILVIAYVTRRISLWCTREAQYAIHEILQEYMTESNNALHSSLYPSLSPACARARAQTHTHTHTHTHSHTLLATPRFPLYVHGGIPRMLRLGPFCWESRAVNGWDLGFAWSESKYICTSLHVRLWFFFLLLFSCWRRRCNIMHKVCWVCTIQDLCGLLQ